MENYVNQLLKDADLSVVTKKHVRMKYKEHVGRELNHEEKSKINDMVYAFVKELSAASNQIISEPEATEKTTNSNEESPGNKENKQSNNKSSTFIIKGQVVDRNDLYKSSSKKKPDKSPHEKEKHRIEEGKEKRETPDKWKETINKQKAAAAKLKINEVMSAVLGPDKGESSSEVSDVSSLTDTSVSEGEEDPEMGKQINEALEKLKAARDKKIQMSIEKKKKIDAKEKVKVKTKARKSLKMESKKDKSKSKKIKEDSDNLSDNSDLGSIENDKAKNKLTRNGLKGNDSSKRMRVKSNSDSEELTLKKTPQKYGAGKKLISDKETANGSKKRKRLVKRKRKVIKDDTTSESEESDDDVDNDSDYNEDLENLKDKRNNQRQKRTVLKSKKEKEKIESDSVSDSEDETLDKIAAKKKLNVKPAKEKSDNVMKKKNNKKGSERGKNLKKSDNTEEIGIDSDISTGDTPLIKKKKVKSKIEDDSDISTGETPLIKKKKVKSKNDNDSENEKDRTPSLIKKKLKKSENEGSDSADSPLTKKSVKNISMNSINDRDVENSEEVSHKSNDEHETSILDKKEKYNISDVNSVKSSKRKRELSERSNASTNDTPSLRKNKKQKQDKTQDKENDSESELSDINPGDTPVVKRALRNTSVHLDEQDIKEDMDESVDNSSKNNTGEKESPCSNPEKSENPQNKENCDNTTDIDSPIQVVKKHGKVKRQLKSSSESDEESPIKMPSRKKKTMQKKTPSGKAVNGTRNQFEANSPNISDNSDVDSDSSDDLPLAQIKNTVKTKISDLSSDSEDDIPLSKTKAAQSKDVITSKASKSKKPEGNVPTSDVAYLRLLRQICRECQMFVRNDRELAGCNTDKEKIERLEQMLRDVGMKGKPTMKKAEEVRLMKEAKELSADNIISSETGRVMRKVKSIWARRTISPVKPVKPAHGNPFAGLQDIVDNEGSESD